MQECDHEVGHPIDLVGSDPSVGEAEVQMIGRETRGGRSGEHLVESRDRDVDPGRVVRAELILARVRPVDAEVADVGERVTERAEFPIEHSRHLTGLPVDEAVAEPIVAVCDRDADLRRKLFGQTPTDLVDGREFAGLRLLPLRRPTAHLPLDVPLTLREVAETDLGGLTDGQRRAFRARRVGFVFQSFALLDYLTARENILYPYRIVRSLRLDTDARQRAVRLAEACGIGGKLDRHPGALSQGEQQRVAICRALVTCPSLILADEATGNLDPETKTVILDLLFERAAEAGATLLAVTHDHELLARFDRVIDFADLRQASPA